MSFCILGSVELLCICGTRITRTTRITRIIHDRRAMRGFSECKVVYDMMEVLKDVVGIMDMDGFYVHGSFLCKELGVGYPVHIGTEVTSSPNDIMMREIIAYVRKMRFTYGAGSDVSDIMMSLRIYAK